MILIFIEMRNLKVIIPEVNLPIAMWHDNACILPQQE